MQSMWIKCIVTVFLFFMSVEDVKSRNIYIAPCIGMFFGGIILWIVQKNSVLEIVYGVLIAVLICILNKITGGGVGLGDGAVFLAISSWVGKSSMGIFLVALFITGAMSVILVLMKKISVKTQLPFVPFILLAYVLEEVVSCL